MPIAARKFPGVNILGRIAQGLERIGLIAPLLDADDLLDSATRRVGANDVGDSRCLLGMARFLQAFAREANANLVGKMMCRQMVLTYLQNRLLIEAKHKSELGVPAEPIAAPVFITGLPRTGTTLLFNLLAQDVAFRVPLGWELEAPCPLPGGSLSRDLRLDAARKAFRRLGAIIPDFRLIHEFGADLPQECVAIFGHQFSSPQFLTMFNVPSYQRWFEDQPAKKLYQFHRRFLQVLQHNTPPRRWVLKSPAHLPYIAELFEEYPDAFVIQLHRDPSKVIPSFASFSHALRTISDPSTDPSIVGEQQLRLWERSAARGIAARRRLENKARRCLDVSYVEFIAHPMSIVARIYDAIGMALRPKVVDQMQVFLRANPQAKYGVHRYSLVEFGLRRPTVREAFAEYIDRFGVGDEV